MTNETEKKFFDAFGIEPEEGDHECLSEDTPTCKRGFTCVCPENCTSCKWFERFAKVYPEITDRILLKLICLLVAHYWKTKEHYYPTALDEECLRKEILNDACYVIDGMLSREKEVDFINQVRELFGEGEEE